MKQEQMNAQSCQILDGLLINTERDLRPARMGGDREDAAKAHARLDTLRAALESDAACHPVERPWSQETVQ